MGAGSGNKVTGEFDYVKLETPRRQYIDPMVQRH